MHKLNKKGYMLVELILAAAIAFGMAYFLISLTMKLKNKNDDVMVESLTSTDQAIITNMIMKQLYETDGDGFDSSCHDLNVGIDLTNKKFTYGGKTNIVNQYATLEAADCTGTDSDTIKIKIPLKVTNTDKNFDVAINYSKKNKTPVTTCEYHRNYYLFLEYNYISELTYGSSVASGKPKTTPYFGTPGGSDRYYTGPTNTATWTGRNGVPDGAQSMKDGVADTVLSGGAISQTALKDDIINFYTRWKQGEVTDLNKTIDGTKYDVVKWFSGFNASYATHATIASLTNNQLKEATIYPTMTMSHTRSGNDIIIPVTREYDYYSIFKGNDYTVNESKVVPIHYNAGAFDTYEVDIIFAPAEYYVDYKVCTTT